MGASSAPAAVGDGRFDAGADTPDGLNAQRGTPPPAAVAVSASVSAAAYTLSSLFLGQPKGKADLYPADELTNLLQIHDTLSQTAFAPSSSSSSPTTTSLTPEREPAVPASVSRHDLVVREGSSDLDPSTTTSPVMCPTTQPPASAPGSSGWASGSSASSLVLSPDVRAKLKRTKMIASDVDGTLLTRSSSLHPRTRQALYRALDAVRDPTHPLQYLCLATGKTRVGALLSLQRADPVLGDELSKVPGVFIQGLYCVDGVGGVDNSGAPRILWDRRLEKDPTLAVERLAEDLPWLREVSTLFGYRCDDIHYLPDWSQSHHVAELHEVWGEPKPIPVESFGSLLLSHSDNDDWGGGDGGRLLHKLLIMDSDASRLSTKIRPAVEDIAASYGCTVTQAIPTMIELLPPGCSKEEGVRQLCRSLLVGGRSGGDGGKEIGSPTIDSVVAIGDAENDVGMLGAAAVGFAVGNAVPAAREAADIVFAETNDHGGAGAAIEMVLEHLGPT